MKPPPRPTPPRPVTNATYYHILTSLPPTTYLPTFRPLFPSISDPPFSPPTPPRAYQFSVPPTLVLFHIRLFALPRSTHCSPPHLYLNPPTSLPSSLSSLSSSPPFILSSTLPSTPSLLLVVFYFRSLISTSLIPLQPA